MMKMLLRLLLNILLGPQKDSDLALENLALRQQLATMKRAAKQLRLRTRDCLDHAIVMNESHLKWTREGHSH